MTKSYVELAQSETTRRFDELKRELADAEGMIAGKACVYATGSFGRLEAGPHSDLDLFIVSDFAEIEKNGEKVRISRLDGIEEIELKHRLIQAVAKCKIEKFDGGGRYLECHPIDAYVRDLGTRDDDYNNTLTGRLLLLLESRPLLGQSLYDRLLANVLDAYFGDFAGNENKFLPAFLTNDILRMWRTFCVNYELSRKKGGNDYKIKNLKLKYSRMLTCYSAILYLLLVHTRANTVSPKDIVEMVKLTPMDRLKKVRDEGPAIVGSQGKEFANLIEELLADYARFLELTHKEKKALLVEYNAHSREWREKSYIFGKKFAEALSILGQSRRPMDGLYRIILI